MRDDQPLLGELCRKFYRAVTRVLLNIDPRMYQLEGNIWRNEQAQEGRAQRISGMIRRLRQP